MCNYVQNQIFESNFKLENCYVVGEPHLESDLLEERQTHNLS